MAMTETSSLSFPAAWGPSMLPSSLLPLFLCDLLLNWEVCPRPCPPPLLPEPPWGCNPPDPPSCGPPDPARRRGPDPAGARPPGPPKPPDRTVCRGRGSLDTRGDARGADPLAEPPFQQVQWKGSHHRAGGGWTEGGSSRSSLRATKARGPSQAGGGTMLKPQPSCCRTTFRGCGKLR